MYWGRYHYHKYPERLFKLPNAQKKCILFQENFSDKNLTRERDTGLMLTWAMAEQMKRRITISLMLTRWPPACELPANFCKAQPSIEKLYIYSTNLFQLARSVLLQHQPATGGLPPCPILPSLSSCLPSNYLMPIQWSYATKGCPQCIKYSVENQPYGSPPGLTDPIYPEGRGGRVLLRATSGCTVVIAGLDSWTVVMTFCCCCFRGAPSGQWWPRTWLGWRGEREPV